MTGLLMNAWINQNRAVVMWMLSLFCFALTVLNYFYNFYNLCVVNALQFHSLVNDDDRWAESAVKGNSVFTTRGRRVAFSETDVVWELQRFAFFMEDPLWNRKHRFANCLQHVGYIYKITHYLCIIKIRKLTRTWEKLSARHFSWRTSMFLIGRTYLKSDFPRNMNWFQNPFAFVEDEMWAKFTAGLEILVLFCKIILEGWFVFSWVTFPSLTTLLKCSILLPTFGSPNEVSRDALVRCETNFLAKRVWKIIPNTCICKVKRRIKWAERMFSIRRVAEHFRSDSESGVCFISCETKWCRVRHLHRQRATHQRHNIWGKR